MAKITPFDRLFVTIRKNGLVEYISDISGVSSLAEIVGCVKSRYPDLTGLATLGIRNASGGWSTSQAILLK